MVYTSISLPWEPRLPFGRSRGIGRLPRFTGVRSYLERSYDYFLTLTCHATDAKFLAVWLFSLMKTIGSKTTVTGAYSRISLPLSLQPKYETALNGITSCSAGSTSSSERKINRSSNVP